MSGESNNGTGHKAFGCAIVYLHGMAGAVARRNPHDTSMSQLSLYGDASHRIGAEVVAHTDDAARALITQIRTALDEWERIITADAQLDVIGSEAKEAVDALHEQVSND